jgi:hypothetical protein
LQLSCQLLNLPNGFWVVVVVGVWKNQSTTINLCKTSSRKLHVKILQRFDEEETLEIQGKCFECRINQSVQKIKGKKKPIKSNSMENQEEETLEIQLRLRDLIARDHHHHHHLVKYLQCKIDSG